ncbi:MAG: hypothetical protein AB3N06_08480 [Erythrobacter sp.]
MTDDIDDEQKAHDREAERLRDGALIDDHAALRNQSSVNPQAYPAKDRQDQSLVRKPGKGK